MASLLNASPFPGMDRADISYSMRRYYIDRFHRQVIPEIASGSRVLDLGGNKIHKRGVFEIEHFDLRVTYLNVSRIKRPDVEADAENVPIATGAFDVVICSELLEHVFRPVLVLHEAWRVLRPGGQLLVCVPFLFPIHGDPEDFGRHTHQWWRATLETVGFCSVLLEMHGHYWSVLYDMLRGLANRRCQRWSKQSLRRQALEWTMRRLRVMAANLDGRQENAADEFIRSYTTGYGIRAIRHE